MAQGAHVVMACRNDQLCGEAATRLRAMGLPGKCECSHLDLLDHASIRQFVEQQAKESAAMSRSSDDSHANSGGASLRRVDVLINNAGKSSWSRRRLARLCAPSLAGPATMPST